MSAKKYLITELKWTNSQTWRKKSWCD